MKKLLEICFICILVIPIYSQKANAQACPNGGFEDWVDHAYSEPDSGWMTSNQLTLTEADSVTVWTVAGFSGQAVHMETAIIGSDTLRAELELGGTIPYNAAYETTNQGGVPYSQMPAAIMGYYRYSLPGNDSASIEVVFKKTGVVVADDVFKLRGSGSLLSFTAFSFPLTLSVIPDSVIILASSSNLSGSGVQSGSWLELDQLAFTGPGITQNIPGGSFDSWIPKNDERPAGWYPNLFGSVPPVTQSTIHYSGSYSVELTTQPYTPLSGGGSVSPAYLSTPFSGNDGLPYTDTAGILAGYYMYIAAGDDSAQLYADAFHSGEFASGFIRFFGPAATWTYFEVPLHSGIWVLSPDSLKLFFQSGDDFAALPGSVLRLDGLHITDTSLLTGVSNSPYADKCSNML